MSELRVNATATAGGTDAYRYVDTVYFTSNGTFTKASYPWLRAIRVKVQGGGGAGGGAEACGAGESSSGAGGGAGHAAESFITDIASLASSETVTVGSGGAGVSASAGNNGGTSSFGSLVSAGGGLGNGYRGATTGIESWRPTPQTVSATGDLTYQGGIGEANLTNDNQTSYGGSGGASLFSGGGYGRGAGNGQGNAGRLGSGGGGSNNRPNTGTTNLAGGNGGDGIVVVELYA